MLFVLKHFDLLGTLRKPSRTKKQVDLLKRIEKESNHIKWLK